MAKLDRRDFLMLVGAGSVGTGAGLMIAESIKHPVEHLIPYPVAPEDFSHGISTWYNTVCSMCSAGCGISVRTLEGRAKKIEGNPAHPVNQGRLCALGQAGLQALYNPDRLVEPLQIAGDRGSGNFRPVTWDAGIAEVANQLQALRENGQGNRVCLLTGDVRGHFAALLESFMVALGSDRLLHYDFSHPHALYAATEIVFGQQNLPYYDLKNTNYLLSFGADYIGRWISPVHHGLGFGHSRQGRGDSRGRFVQIEPRMSLSGAAADEWIPARPGTEGMLALGIARHIVAEGGYTGADRDTWSEALARYGVDDVAGQTGVAAATIAHLAEDFATTQPSLAIGGGAAGNYSNGLDTLVAVNALNYLAGNLGQEGGLLFNPDPAFGSSGHTRHARFSTMTELADAARNGEIEMLIVSDANPVFGLPAAAEFAQAMAAIPFIVSLSSFMDETTAWADLILPSHTYLESWGDDTPEPGVGFTVGAISQPVVSPLYNTRATGDILLGIAQAADLGDTLPWADTEDYLKARWREIHARGAADDFDEFWIDVLKAGVWGSETRQSATVSIRVDAVQSIAAAPPEFAGAADEFPFVLHPYLSNALHDGRGANLPWMQELPDPMTSVVYGSWVELNPATAEELGLRDGDLVKVQSTSGSVSVPVCVFPAIRPDTVAMPIGQGHAEFGRYAKNRGGNPIQILAPITESRTGDLAWAATRVKLVPTGRRATLVRTGGVSRQLGRGIVQTTGGDADSHASLNSIPITVEPA